ncbi:hypothetical protein D3C73_965400 [compost metagenome]
MVLMGWYNVGTVTATLNNATVTGAGTLFLANVRVGDGITIAGSTTIHEVTNVASNTQLTISPVYPGTTGASKTYAIIPVQGYVQSLADQAKSLILTFSNVGSSVSVNALAGITGAADMIPYFTSGSTMWTTPLTLMARGLLDDPTAPAMRTTLGLKTAAVADLLGPVSNGAVMERGSNANGEYVRYANGAIEMWGTCVLPAGAALTQLSVVALFPTLFYDNTYHLTVTPVGANGSGYQGSIGEYYMNGPFLSLATDRCTVLLYTYRSAQTNALNMTWRAVGRWQPK